MTKSPRAKAISACLRPRSRARSIGLRPTDGLSANGVVVGIVVGEAADEIDDGAPRLGVGNTHERLVELQAVATAQKLDDGALGGLLGEAVGHELAVAGVHG